MQSLKGEGSNRKTLSLNQKSNQSHKSSQKGEKLRSLIQEHGSDMRNSHDLEKSYLLYEDTLNQF